ncbi:glutamine synthetase family protein [Xanthomonas campestris]|uniref:glutamine synthetase family protein n=1 Tax=Xanthomonas campestris TaxID=339 RepID=UPI001E5758A4|nr:glutamine synthetase family protein [Xanthomonas campestris]MCC8684458.1 glutamine synthetase family protein [Xanthomonas campestris]MCC8691681.1 glutamine synthetase family protein [Xanthomonas campestris]MCW1998536.1 glutamine synthetase [Xanthomonas campestris]MEA9678620.1 glutamine synthetase family protein [Xanthomonas campestris pv. raphani]MEA9698003.1 glutamine synthetase family protein [Xanthomonas campestris pv. raphani]
MSIRTRSRKSTPKQPESALRRWLKERHITEVECLVPDITGNARGKIIPADKFSHDYGTRLPEGIFATTVTGDFPDDYYALTSPSDSDMHLRPDASTVRMVPWAADPTAQVIHDCYTKDGQPHELAPRNVLRRVLDAYAEVKLQPVVAPELEFFLVQKNTDPDFPLLPPAGRSGRPETARQSYSIDAVNEFDPILDLMYDYCDAMELDVDTLIHESGAAQLEVNFTHADALSRADQVFLFKRTMREAALRHGVYATFLAKPMETEPGSAMHIHQSLLHAGTGKNVFSGKLEGGFSDTFAHYLGGLQKYIPMAMGLLAPNVNSYRRLMFGEVSPSNVLWGFDNRTCGLRVPIDAPQNMRVESRFAGSDANPYLAMAATLACGLLGIREKLEPTAPISSNGKEQGYDLPRSLGEALDELEGCEALKEMLGPRFVRAYISVKRKEYETFFRVISSWEREFLLLNV